MANIIDQARDSSVKQKRRLVFLVTLLVTFGILVGWFFSVKARLTTASSDVVIEGGNGAFSGIQNFVDNIFGDTEIDLESLDAIKKENRTDDLPVGEPVTEEPAETTGGIQIINQSEPVDQGDETLDADPEDPLDPETQL